MLKRHVSLLTFTGALCLLGCGEAPRGETNAKDLQGRYRAAELISDGEERNAAFAPVAEDAGRAGQADMARRSVEQIGVAELRNSTADSVAVALARAGESEAAVAVARLMTDGDLRDQTLQKIATQP